MQNKICLVTGASDGIGRATAFSLAAMGAQVVIVCRNREKGEMVLHELDTLFPGTNPELMIADLGEMNSIRRLAVQFHEKFERLDVLINNAGVFSTRAEYTVDGIEKQFAINHLASFLLTHLLLDAIRASGSGRIINVSSFSHRFGKIKFNDLFRKNGYDGLGVYGQSKLANVLFTYELARRLKSSGITVNCLHPGRVRTDIGNKNAKGIYPWLWKLNKPFMISPREGAKTTVFLASSPELKNITGKYFYRCRERRSSALSHNKELAEKLWKVSEEMTKPEWRQHKSGKIFTQAGNNAMV